MDKGALLTSRLLQDSSCHLSVVMEFSLKYCLINYSQKHKIFLIQQCSSSEKLRRMSNKQPKKKLTLTKAQNRTLASIVAPASRKKVLPDRSDLGLFNFSHSQRVQWGATMSCGKSPFQLRARWANLLFWPIVLALRIMPFPPHHNCYETHSSLLLAERDAFDVV